MDFGSITVGIFVYHCHLIGHEDNGMMAKIQVRNKLCSMKQEGPGSVSCSTSKATNLITTLSATSLA
jgi:hypothetical protein